MRLQFLDSTRPKDIQQLFYQTRKKLSDEAAKLPKGVIGPFFNDEYSDVYFALYALEAEHLPHRQQVQMAEVDLVASLANTQLTVADIMELRVGDVIPIEIDKVIEARVDNVPVFNCSYGTSGGQYALKVEEVMSVSNESHADALNLEALLNRENKQPEKAHQQ